MKLHATECESQKGVTAEVTQALPYTFRVMYLQYNVRRNHGNVGHACTPPGEEMSTSSQLAFYFNDTVALDEQVERIGRLHRLLEVCALCWGMCIF